MNTPSYWTVPLSGAVQRVTVPIDVTGLINIYAAKVQFQNSNDSNNTCYIGYSAGAAPASIDKTSALVDLAAGQAEEPPDGERMRLRGHDFDLKNFFVQGTAGDYLHVVIPTITNTGG